MQLVVHLGWHFTIQAKGNLLVFRAFKPRCKVSGLVPAQGEIRLFHTLQVTERRFGPVQLMLAHVRTAKGYEVWISPQAASPRLRENSHNIDMC